MVQSGSDPHALRAKDLGNMGIFWLVERTDTHRDDSNGYLQDIGLFQAHVSPHGQQAALYSLLACPHHRLLVL